MSKEIFVAFATQKGGIGKSTVTALAASFALWATVWARSCGGQRDTRAGPTAATTTFQRFNYIIFIKMI